jgi:DNA (cytosine-5)-methyltransferase 1
MTIKIGTDCSGMEAPIQAIRNLKVKYDHKFSCDIDKHARTTIAANFPPEHMYTDLTKRDNSVAPSVDMYIAGFPCQPFSSAGVRQGFKDRKKRGEIFFYVLDFIATKRPRVFVLENVSGLVNIQGGKYLKAILQELQKLGGYNIYHKILNTKEQGIPHHRKRWYCVGIAKKYDTGAFAFPKPIQMPPLQLFLERKNTKLAATGLPPKSATTARFNVIETKQKLRQQGKNPPEEPVVIDCDSSTYRYKWKYDHSPCITVARGKGHWLVNRGRRQTKTEIMRLQGMDPTKFVVATTDPQLGKQLGNTMSVNVLERLFVSLLPAARLVRKSSLRDRWASGQAVKQLSRTRGRGFQAMSAAAKRTMRYTEDKKAIKTTSALAKQEDAESLGSKRRLTRSSLATSALKRVRR